MAEQIVIKHGHGPDSTQILENQLGLENVLDLSSQKAEAQKESQVLERIGDGIKTLFWDHCWALDRPLVEVATGELDEEDLGHTVAEYWSDGGWRWDLLTPLLPPDALAAIANISIVEEGVGDNHYKRNSASDVFSIRPALGIIRDAPNSDRDQLWKKIWSLNATERVRTFIWLAAHSSIMCNETRRRRRLCDDDLCRVCNVASETTIHVLRDCIKARELWDELLRDRTNPVFFLGSIKPWLLQNLSGEGMAVTESQW